MNWLNIRIITIQQIAVNGIRFPIKMELTALKKYHLLRECPFIKIQYITGSHIRRRFGRSTYEGGAKRSEEHTSELQSRFDLVCRLLLEKKKKNNNVEQNQHGV